MAPRILVVEDEPQIRNLVTDNLEGVGYEVVGVGTVKDAVGLSGPWNLLILDQRLPNGKGKEVRNRFPHIPVIFMSGWPEELEVTETFLPKPFTRGQLLAVVMEKIG